VFGTLGRLQTRQPAFAPAFARGPVLNQPSVMETLARP
jgi:hypothetical protein